MTPLVSIVMLSYNHAPYLPAAIESVLAQTVEDLELVVADDGSTDGSLDIARRYEEADPRVRVLTHPGHVNRGIGATVNLVRSATSGRYQLGLPSDDVLLPDALELTVDFLERHPEVGYVYGHVHLIDGDGNMILQPDGREPVAYGADLTEGGRFVERLVQRNTIPAMTALWRRACLQQAGEEHATLVYGDWEHQARGAAHWDVAFIPRALALYRVHGMNTSLDIPRETRIARHLEVTEVLRERAPAVGGRLAEPRVRAVLELQVGYLRFAAGDTGGEADLRAAFERDPSLAGDARWLSDWLWARPLDELLPSEGPDFARWFHGAVQTLLEPRAARTVRREVAAVSAQARAIRLARDGRLAGAAASALLAWARSPRQLGDPQLKSILLDAIVRTRSGAALRRARWRLLRRG